ncbi:hypothetical protein GGI23_002983 [Coemansia sp. RSA 2559]|nr:hypothetical protein GGI23_002983 [Coemansia sp. RSA 2559]
MPRPLSGEQQQQQQHTSSAWTTDERQPLNHRHANTAMSENEIDNINKPLELTDKDKATLASYVRKCDRRLLLYLCIGYGLDSINKMALSYAKIAGLTDDLGLSGDDINVALGTYYLGSFLFQLPSNVMLKRTRPRWWLSASMAAWSTVTMLMALSKTPGDLAGLRFAFGAVQAGYLTGSLYYISYWYPRDLVRRRTGWFFASAGVGGILVGPLCSGLSAIHSPHIASWQLIFIVAGACSAVWSTLGPHILQDYPDTATFITDEERQLVLRIMVRQNTVASTQSVSLRQIAMAVADRKVWLWTIIDFCANGATQVNGMFGPTIIASQGFSTVAAQAMTSLTNLMSTAGMASIAYVAHFTGGSARALWLSNTITALGFVLALASRSNAASFVALFMFSFASPQPAAHAPAWMLANLQGSTKPAMAAAFTSAVGGLGPLATAFVYRDKDSPKYVLGHSVCLSMTVLAAIATLALYIILRRENARRDCSPADISHLTPAQVLDLADNHPDFRYKL